MPACPYCNASPEEAWIITEDAIAVPHPNPLTACHVVVAPRRHVLAFYDLDVQEQRTVWNLVSDIQKRISAALKVEGFDVGFADGNAEDPVHTHIHIVPRSPGEFIELPRGIEWVDAD
ncbi:MAG TPA: HIT domain-containing protein [Bryobacteraceae bacterium]